MFNCITQAECMDWHIQKQFFSNDMTKEEYCSRQEKTVIPYL